MDWSGYPIALDPDTVIETTGQLALFLGDDVGSYTHGLLDLLDTGGVGDRALLAGAYPREAIAYATWHTMTPKPNGVQLVAALAEVPDPAPDQDWLVPVQVQRCLIISLPATGQATVTMQHRLDSGQPWKQTQYLVPAPSIEVDPKLLTSSTDARLSLRLTVQDTE